MKKKLALALAAILLVSSFAGCSKKTEGPAVDPTASVEQTTGDDGRKMEGNMYVEGLPIVKDKEEFSIFCDDSGVAEDKIMYPILEEQTNIKVNLMLFPYETATEKKNILLNSNDYPEVFGGWIMGEKDVIDNGVGEGIYLKLEDLMAKYSPKMTEVLNIEGVRQTMTAPDGHIYSVPYVIGEPKVSFLPWINEKWLKALNLQMPTTTEEFRTVLKAFKEKDPNGNDKADEIPFSADPNNMHLGTLAGWFGVNASGATAQARYFAMVDGKLEFSANKEGFKDAMKYLASLYKEGLIDPEIFTQDLAQWKAKGKKDIYGCSIAYGSGDFFEKDPATQRTPFAPLPVLKSEKCDNPIFRRNGYGVTTFKNQVVITDKAKNPASIIRWWDNVFQLDNSVQIQNGTFDILVKKTGEGQYQTLDANKLSEEIKKKNEWGNMFTQSLPKYVPTSLVIAPAEGAVSYDEKKVADEAYEPFLEKQSIPNYWADAEVAKRSSILETDISSFIEKKMAEWVSGQKDVEAEWDSYIAQLDKYGLQELIKIKTDAVAAVTK